MASASQHSLPSKFGNYGDGALSSRCAGAAEGSISAIYSPPPPTAPSLERMMAGISCLRTTSL